ncbi:MULTISPECIES: hypothetical protein [Micrococcaceae]|uniref:hypothetical protein n=1 Tax=unclassified Kocuria TaxID=2649579 RepID=UPI00101158F1|nr:MULTISPECIES: hypothetical protein [unclassified Kocuria]
MAEARDPQDPLNGESGQHPDSEAAAEDQTMGPSAERSEARPTRPREDRPDIRAAKTETRVRRWALLLLVLVPVVYFVVQKLIS